MSIDGLVQHLLSGFGKCQKHLLEIAFLQFVEHAGIEGLGSTVSSGATKYIGFSEMVTFPKNCECISVFSQKFNLTLKNEINGL